MLITFCGHSNVSEMDKVEVWLKEVIENVIKDGATEFYLGGYGDFDILASRVLTTLKKGYPYIKRVLVIPYLDRDFDKKLYDGSYYPSLETVPKRFAISKRNEIIIEDADIVISYVMYSWGGANKTLEFAKKRNKKIISYPKNRPN